jgi:fimbrial chaperone protein
MWTRLLATGLALGLGLSGAAASSLRVSPIGLDLAGGAAASTIRLWNNEKQPVNVQVRIFKWTKVDGKDRFEPTTDVVASPPISKLAGGSENLIRVVRVAKRPLAEKENYRLMVDELPSVAAAGTSRVNIVIRHSIPVRFTP